MKQNKSVLIMFLSLILSFFFLSGELFAYKKSDLKKLRDTKKCIKCDLSGANLQYTNLSGANLSETNLNKANLNKANLNKANLSETNLNKANLRHSDLTGADLTGANLYKAKLTGTDLTGAILSGAILKDSILSWANLTGADLSGANLRGGNLTGTNLKNANLTEIIIDKKAISTNEFVEKLFGKKKVEPVVEEEKRETVVLFDRKKKEKELREKKGKEVKQKKAVKHQKIIEATKVSLQAGENLMTKLKPLPDGQISTVYIGQTNYTELSGRLKTIDILTRFILEPQSNRLFGDSLIDYGEGIERSVIKILRVSLNKITIKDIWGNESKGEFFTATYNTQDSWESFSGDYFIPNKTGPQGTTNGKSINGKNVIKMYLDIAPNSNVKKSGCSATKNVKGYKDFKLCMGVFQVIAMDVCEKFEATKNAKFIGKAFSLAKINNGEVVFGKKCYEIMGKKRDMEFYFSDDQLSSIGVTLSFTGAGTEGKQLFGEFDFEKFIKIQNSLEKKYGLNVDPGKMKISMFLSDLQKMGRIDTIYGDGTVILSILRWRMQDYEPMDEVNVFYNSKSVAESISGTEDKKKLKDDDL